jgi:hypothetical protein
MYIKHRSSRSLLAALVVLGLVGGACQLFNAQPTRLPPTSAPALPTDTAAAAAPGQTPAAAEPTQPPEEIERPPRAVGAIPPFAEFREPETSKQALLQPYSIDANLGNVYNPFLLSGAQLERLALDGFVVTPGSEKEFFTLYEKARYANVPIFVTSDSLLHTYHLLFDKILRTAETEHFIPLLARLNQSLLAKADEQYLALQSSGAGAEWQDAALRTAAFLAVGSRLLDQAAAIPAYTQTLVDQELALIAAADAILPSPIFSGLDNGEDYTQYIPRGHYTRSDSLTAYFKSMMWYGRMTFRLKTENAAVGQAETRQALLLIQAIQTSQVDGVPALQAWSDLYSPTAFFVGRSDDLTVLQYLPVKEQVYGPGAGLAQVADESRLAAFIEAADQLPPPRILGMVIEVSDDEEQETKGLRLMGQRFVPDAYIFRQLIYRNVGTPDHRRGLPMGMDLMAAMGSDRAYQILEESGQTAYANYPRQMQKVRMWLSDLALEEWTETLYNSWIYTFYPLIEAPGEGYPLFMRGQAWQDKQLNTALGSWAELKHDTILYAKQVYAELGGGPPPPEPVPPRGYVEPVPQFYARLAALTSMTRTGLDSRGLLSDLDRGSLEWLERLASEFQVMAEKELAGEPLTQKEYDTIRFYGGDLEHLVMASADTDNGEEFARRYMDEDPQAAVIADVATDPDPGGDGSPDPIVLEEGVGRIHEIHVVAPVIQDDGTVFLQVAKGGVFSYYEFAWPANDRLTDEKWREMLDSGEAPDLPGWTSSFRVEQGEYADLQLAVLGFQKQVTSLFWGVSWAEPDWSGPLGAFQEEFQALKENVQYEGRQLVRSQFTSFDLQSETSAVVTTRETWDDKRYAGEYPDYGVPEIASRGPYTIAVTYTLEQVTEAERTSWKVTGFSYLEAPPGWE